MEGTSRYSDYFKKINDTYNSKKPYIKMWEEQRSDWLKKNKGKIYIDPNSKKIYKEKLFYYWFKE